MNEGGKGREVWLDRLVASLFTYILLACLLKFCNVFCLCVFCVLMYADEKIVLDDK